MGPLLVTKYMLFTGHVLKKGSQICNITSKACTGAYACTCAGCFSFTCWVPPDSAVLWRLFAACSSIANLAFLRIALG